MTVKMMVFEVVQDVGYWVVLGLSLWGQNVAADVKVVYSSYTINPPKTVANCPSGYVIVGILPSVTHTGTGVGVSGVYVTSNANPTQAYSTGEGCCDTYTTPSSFTMICAKLCN